MVGREVKFSKDTFLASDFFTGSFERSIISAEISINTPMLSIK